MKPARVLLILLLTLQGVKAGNSIEFSSVLHDFIGEGITYHRLIFKDGKRTVFYQPPAGWTCSGSENQLHLSPNKNFAEARIESIALDTPVTLDEKATTIIAQQVLNSLPPESQQASIVKQETNSFMVGNNPTFEVIVSCKAIGETLQRSVVFVNTPMNQIIFRLTARKADFDALYRVFHSSVLSWEWQPEPQAQG